MQVGRFISWPKLFELKFSSKILMDAKNATLSTVLDSDCPLVLGSVIRLKSIPKRTRALTDQQGPHNTKGQSSSCLQK